MKQCRIDWDKVNTLEDIKRILKSLEITFLDNYKGLENIKDLTYEVKDEEIPPTEWKV